MKRVVCLTLVLLLFCGTASAISAESACGMTADGEIFFEKNSEEKLPMASTTKIMTCLLALERGNLSDVVTVPGAACGIEGTSLYLKEGDTLTLEDLLYALMLRSANDAAVAVSIHIGGDTPSFVGMMNEKAQALGMTNTHFENPHGLPSENHYTTAKDFASLASYCLKRDDFRSIVSTVTRRIEMGDGTVKPVTNHNRLLRTYDGACGVKTGFTKAAGRCLVSAAERNGVTLVAVTLKAPGDWADHREILDSGFSKYERVVLFEAGSLRRTFPVAGGLSVTLSSDCQVSRTVEKGTSLSYRFIVPKLLFPPIDEGEQVGYLEVLQGENIVEKIPLFAENSVSAEEDKSFLEKIFKWKK